jgi:hypothetical protein
VTSVPLVNSFVVWAGVLAALAAGGGVAWRAVRPFRHAAQQFEEFIDDWRGTPARPGVPERPGMMVRVAGIEQQTQVIPELERRIARVEHELRPNGGASLRDAVDRVDARTQSGSRTG